jgi:rare lipoprotein A
MKTIVTILGVMALSILPIAATEYGVASYYTVRSNHGTRTASGVALKDSALTAAHKTLPFGTKIKITNLKNNKSVVVVITDRGPFIKGRIVDVSLAAADQLGFRQNGIAKKVKIERL